MRWLLVLLIPSLAWANSPSDPDWTRERRGQAVPVIAPVTCGTSSSTLVSADANKYEVLSITFRARDTSGEDFVYICPAATCSAAAAQAFLYTSADDDRYDAITLDKTPNVTMSCITDTGNVTVYVWPSRS